MDLRDVLRVLVRRFWMVILVAATSFSTMVAVRFYTKRDQWVASATFLFRQSLYDVQNVYFTDPQFPISPLSIKDRIILLSSDKANLAVKKKLDDLGIPQPTQISLQPGTEDNSLQVVVQADTKDAAERVITILKELYYELDKREILRALENARARLDEELDPSVPHSGRARAAAARARADRVRREQLELVNVVDPTSELSMRNSQYTSLYQTLVANQKSDAELRFERDQLLELRQKAELQRALERGPFPLPAQQDPPPEAFPLIEEMDNMRLELSTLQKKYHDGYFKVEDLRDKIAALQERIQELSRGPKYRDVSVANRKIQVLEISQAFLKELIEGEKKKIKEVSDALSLISREEEAAKRLETQVADLETKQRDIQQRIQLNPPNFEELHGPVASLAQVQFETSTWAMIALVSVILGVASAYLLEYLSDTIRTVADVKTYMNMATIGLIPEFKGVPHNLLEVAIKSPPYEYYNKLATFIEAALTEKKRKIMMVTSAKEEEGKTSICANLAIALAQSGRRVAIIDADMRKGQMHSIFSLDNSQGLSKALEAPPDAPMPELFDTSVETLKVLPAGPVPINPIMLLRGERAQKMLKTLEEQGGYDVVLVDTPPLMGVIDAAVLASHALPTVMVVQDNVVRRAEMNHVRSNLLRVNADIIGVILNKSRIEPETYYYYYYRYRGYSA